MAAWRTGKPAGENRSRKLSWSAVPWLCAALLIAGLCLMGSGLRGVRAQQTQQPANGQPPSSQPAAQSTDSSSSDTQTDGAEELLKEFPADSASKAASDPRDGHTDTAPGAPAPEEPVDLAPEQNQPQPAVAAAPGSRSAAAPAPPALIELPSDPRQRQVAVECNDLLTMATDLKAAVDKSTKDQLSLDVVRKAGAIEQYARKVRAGTAVAAK